MRKCENNSERENLYVIWGIKCGGMCERVYKWNNCQETYTFNLWLVLCFICFLKVACIKL